MRAAWRERAAASPRCGRHLITWAHERRTAEPHDVEWRRVSGVRLRARRARRVAKVSRVGVRRGGFGVGMVGRVWRRYGGKGVAR